MVEKVSKPVHDNPIGLVHPYWARKPLNVIDAIIAATTSPEDLVVDPFMGSGTTVFSALKLHRQAFGSDISPLSHFIVNGTLDIIEAGDAIIQSVIAVVQRTSEIVLPWFQTEEGEYVERVRFDVNGQYAYGDFSLKPVEFVLKSRSKRGTWGGRRAVEAGPLTSNWLTNNSSHLYQHFPVDFSAITLPANSRIAIPEGAVLKDYFTSENRAAINIYLEQASREELFRHYPDGIRMVLSAAIPMLRLSDKKASSQWPYWRPKNNLTSRNPIVVFERKLKSLQQLHTWGCENMPALKRAQVQLENTAAQNLSPKFLQKKASLVLTDPPYGDQVPYLEYSNMWDQILNLPLNAQARAQELVKSDAKFQSANSAVYATRLAESLRANLALVSEDGIVAWFYQDHDLTNWSTIHDAAEESGFSIVDILAIPKQRRSLKTVTSPNKTLDGDLLVLFARSGNQAAQEKRAALNAALPQIGSEMTYYSKYVTVLKQAVVTGNISSLAAEYGTVEQLMEARGL